MVLKTSKRGVRTGGTLRSHPGAVKRYENRSSDPKAQVTFFRPANQESSLQLPEQFESGVQYSLNKRDRWNLPAKVHEQVHALAIEDHRLASREDEPSRDGGRKSVVLVQHPGMDDFHKASDKHGAAKGNYVLYYGDRYTIPVERSSRKSKLDPMNVVAQLDEGSFFGGRNERSSAAAKRDEDVEVSEDAEQTKSGARNRRVIRRVQEYDGSKRLVQVTGPRSAPEETQIEGEHIHVFLADKKLVNKRQVLKQPKKVVDQQLPTARQTRHDVYDSDEADYSSAEDEQYEEEEQSTARPPAASTFRLSDFVAAC